ncbi:MAG: ATP-binding protein [Acidimicrobiales bacterium]|jgi:DNA polymerase-3 subunit delta'
MSPLAPAAPVLDRIVGQPSALRLLRASVAQPLHAYLFVGPPGTGREEAASAFAAALFCPEGGCGVCTVCQETLAGRHPDLVVVERKGASISVAQASEVVRLASRTPRAAPYQVLVLVDFHLLGTAAPSLLKTIEEPPDTTVIIVTAESVPADFVTIASRCARVEFRPLAEPDLVDALTREGTDRLTAEAVAQVAQGRLDRARVLMGDEGFSERIARWRQLPSRLDGTGATAAKLAAELVAAANETVEVVKTSQSAELERLADEAKAAGERGVPGRAEIDARHRREQRRVRTDDLRAGLATLAGVFRSRLGGGSASAKTAIQAIELIDEAAARLLLNVNEVLLLEWLLVELDRLG